MSAPGGGFGEGTHGGPERPDWKAPWDAPASYYPPQAYPPPGYGGWGGWGQPEAPRHRMNGTAIASLISSFVGVFCCVGAIAAIALGTIALDQIKRTRQDGYAVAVSGIVIGVATLIVWSIVAIVAAHSR